MADALTTITELLNKPEAAWGGQLVAGAALAGIAWKFFDKVEAVLSDQTKFEIAVWLVGIKTADKVPWPDTFSKIVDRVFGTKPLSWKAFGRSCIISFTIMMIVLAVISLPFMRGRIVQVFDKSANVVLLGIALPLLNLLPDYLSLLKTRFAIDYLKGVNSFIVVIGILLVDMTVSILIAATPVTAVFSGVSAIIYNETWASQFVDFLLVSYHYGYLFLPSAIFASGWLWLFAGSGFLLKFARRFDLGFDWFNRKFDIEKKPLSAIGLVAGSLVALLYWAWAVVRYFHPA